YSLGGYDEDGTVLPFEVVTPYLYQGGGRFTVNELELVMETGVGTLTDDPQIMFSRTKDGVIWSTEKQRRLGKTGHRLKQVRLGRQGQSRGCAFRLRITDPYKRALVGLYADVVGDAA